MAITQKCQYALRALFELARRDGQGPVKIGTVAEVQSIPPRFLEGILNQLKAGGFVESLRGKEGGYRLLRSPKDISVGDVIRYLQGPLAPVDCDPGASREPCGLYGDCVFRPLWERAQKALESVYDSTTIQDFVDRQAERERCGSPRRSCGGRDPETPVERGERT